MRALSLFAVLVAAAGSAQAQETNCTFQDAATGTVRAVLDGRSFVLTDGREVRLAGIDVADSVKSRAGENARQSRRHAEKAG
jgi:endonuclease YncB( thermonuclease family)